MNEKITYTYACEYCDAEHLTNEEALDCCDVLRQEGLEPNF